IQQFTFFDQADRFLATVRYIEAIRERLSPATRTTVNEIGSISADDGDQTKPGHVTKPIPNSYWNLSGATFAYVFAHLAELGIDVAGESQLIGYPTQFPSVSMVDWTTGAPNARFRILQLLKDNFGPGDKIVESSVNSPYIDAFAVIKPNGARKLLLINKRDRAFKLAVPLEATRLSVVDQTTKGGTYAISRPAGKSISLGGLAVAVVDFK
ncbi:MAG TPA: glycosyl hydrolase family 39, partial [Bryobacteraceae bacterium]